MQSRLSQTATTICLENLFLDFWSRVKTLSDSHLLPWEIRHQLVNEMWPLQQCNHPSTLSEKPNRQFCAPSSTINVSCDQASFLQMDLHYRTSAQETLQRLEILSNMQQEELVEVRRCLRTGANSWYFRLRSFTQTWSNLSEGPQPKTSTFALLYCCVLPALVRVAHITHHQTQINV